EAYGGMSINLADGYALAYFHTTLAPGLAAGQTVRQGQYLGTVAPPGQGGNGGFPHIHITLWSTTDGGNWSRNAVAFSGGQSIEGVSLPALADTSVNQYRGTTFTSTNTGLAAEVLPPAAPVHLSPAHGVTYDATSQVVTLNWAASTGATEYQVWINDAPASGWISSTSWTTPSLGTGQYAWQVKARGAGGEGSLSGKWVFWVDPSDGGDLPTLSETPGTLGISNSPTSGAPGANIVVTGAGMSANETVSVYWDSVSGTRIGQTVANSAGNWRITFTLPDATGGQHQILARGATSNRNAASTFSVSPSLQQTPISGVPGTSIAVTVKGFGDGELVSLSFYHNGSSVHALGSLRTDANGSGTTTVTLPSSTTGQHDYRAVGTTSGISAWGALWIQPSMTLSSDQGAAGDSVTATVRGMPGSSTVRVSWNEWHFSRNHALHRNNLDHRFLCLHLPDAGQFGRGVSDHGDRRRHEHRRDVRHRGIGGNHDYAVERNGRIVVPDQSRWFPVERNGAPDAGRIQHRLADGHGRIEWNGAGQGHDSLSVEWKPHDCGARRFERPHRVGTVSISPSMELSSSGGASGSSASAWMRGFKADTSITLRFNATNATNGVSSCSGRTDSNGSFDCAFTVPASAPGPIRSGRFRMV
ncbi:MAG: hypothetical protein R2845_13815, partial [Thermomicrobiales bacterium]